MAFWDKLKKEKTVSQESTEKERTEIITAWRPSAVFSTTTSSSPTISGYTTVHTSSWSPVGPKTCISTWDLDVVDDKLIINTSDNKCQIDRQTLLESIDQVRYHNYTRGRIPDNVFPLASLLLMYLDAVTKVQADD